MKVFAHYFKKFKKNKQLKIALGIIEKKIWRLNAKAVNACMGLYDLFQGRSQLINAKKS